MKAISMLWKLLRLLRWSFMIFLTQFVTFVTRFVTRTSCNYVAGQHRTSSSTWSASKKENEKKTGGTVILRLHWLHLTTSQFPGNIRIIRIEAHPFTSIISTFVSQMDHAPTCICTDKISIALKANLQIWSTNQRGSRNKGIKYDVSDVYSCGLCTCWLHISKWRGENKMLSNHISLCGFTSKVLPPECILKGHSHSIMTCLCSDAFAKPFGSCKPEVWRMLRMLQFHFCHCNFHQTLPCYVHTMLLYLKPWPCWPLSARCNVFQRKLCWQSQIEKVSFLSFVRGMVKFCFELVKSTCKASILTLIFSFSLCDPCVSGFFILFYPCSFW